jgi:hypothetical protein
MPKKRGKKKKDLAVMAYTHLYSKHSQTEAGEWRVQGQPRLHINTCLKKKRKEEKEGRKGGRKERRKERKNEREQKERQKKES